MVGMIAGCSRSVKNEIKMARLPFSCGLLPSGRIAEGFFYPLSQSDFQFCLWRCPRKGIPCAMVRLAASTPFLTTHACLGSRGCSQLWAASWFEFSLEPDPFWASRPGTAAQAWSRGPPCLSHQPQQLGGITSCF